LSILRASGIDNRHIDYIVDDSPAKQGRFTPGSNIPVVSPNGIKRPDYFIILAPNYSNQIIEKEKRYIKEGGLFIVPKEDITVLGKSSEYIVD